MDDLKSCFFRKCSFTSTPAARSVSMTTHGCFGTASCRASNACIYSTTSYDCANSAHWQIGLDGGIMMLTRPSQS